MLHGALAPGVGTARRPFSTAEGFGPPRYHRRTRLGRLTRPGTRITGRSWSRSRPIKRALRVEPGPARPTRGELLLARRVDRVGINPVPCGVGAAQDPVVPVCQGKNEGI